MDLQLPDCGLKIDRRDDVIIARFTQRLVLSGPVAEVVAKQLMELLPELGSRRLLIDFGNVQSLTSLMLGKLVRLNHATEAAGARLALFNLSPVLREILEVSRMNLILLLYDTEAEALQGS
jgi:anti-sigma B factor antagonist